MKALIFILALTWAIVPAHASDAEEQAQWEKGEIGSESEEPAPNVAMIVHQDYLVNEPAPKAGAVVAVDGMSPFQKLPGGYLIRLHPNAISDPSEALSIGFLKTNQQLNENAWLRGNVRFKGFYDYQSIVGYVRHVPAFDEIKAEPVKMGLP